jgi:hypothetical protein
VVLGRAWWVEKGSELAEVCGWRPAGSISSGFYRA